MKDSTPEKQTQRSQATIFRSRKETMSGFIKLSRNIESWEFRSDPLAMALWINLLLMAEWKDSEEAKAGELVISSRRLSEITGISRNCVHKLINQFKEAGQIDVEATQQGTKITLLNYSKYMAERGSYKSHSDDGGGSQENQERFIQEPQVAHRRTTGGSYKSHSDDSHPYLIEEQEEYKKSKNRKPLTLFEEFRKSYPKKDSKEKVLQAYQKALDSGVTEEDLLFSLNQWKSKQWDRWPEDEKKYIPGVVKWLESEKWSETVTEYVGKKKKMQLYKWGGGKGIDT